MSAYDKAKWHYGGDFPKDLPDEAGFTHTGMFLGWLIVNDLISDEMGEDFADSLVEFKSRSKTGSQLYQEMDGVFCDDMVNEEGRVFTESYYEPSDSQFLSDYSELLFKGIPTIYHVKDTWENFDMLSKRMDQRFAEFRKSQKST